MKKLSLIIPALIVSAAVAFAGTTFLRMPANGDYSASLGPVKVVAIDIIGAASNNTVVLKRKTSAGAAVTVLSITCSNAVEQITLPGTLWLFKGDVIERSGTATNAPVRLILQQ